MLIKGTLLEYGGNLFGPIPNIVFFQFNPETLSRQIQIQQRPSGTSTPESNQIGERPYESITLTAYFSSADSTANGNPISSAFGVGPQLAALEKMVYPSAGNIFSNLVNAVDQIGDLISGSSQQTVSNPIPREIVPQILFIWGLGRVLPVDIASMTINEKQYDNMLNPVEAEVSIGLRIKDIGPCSDDKLAQGAMIYSNAVKDTQATANMINQAAQIITDIVSF